MALKSLNISLEGDQNQKIQLIKVHVLDLADRFDALEETQMNQNAMLNYLVNCERRRQDSEIDMNQSLAQKDKLTRYPTVKGEIIEADEAEEEDGQAPGSSNSAQLE